MVNPIVACSQISCSWDQDENISKALRGEFGNIFGDVQADSEESSKSIPSKALKGSKTTKASAVKLLAPVDKIPKNYQAAYVSPSIFRPLAIDRARRYLSDRYRISYLAEMK